MRKSKLSNGEYYHIYNRGVDKRDIVSDVSDVERFFQSMEEFNSIEPVGSIYLNSLLKNRQLRRSTSQNNKKLVNFICYRLNPNHFHFILEQLVENGISEFMKRLSGGYAKYFNEKYKRSGALFQGRFKSIHINNNEYILRLSVYINLNDKVHQLDKLRHRTSQLGKSSWLEYTGDKEDSFCHKNIVLEQFKNKKEYKKFAEETLSLILDSKIKQKELREELFLE